MSGDIVDRIDAQVDICSGCKKAADRTAFALYGRCYRCAFQTYDQVAAEQIENVASAPTETDPDEPCGPNGEALRCVIMVDDHRCFREIRHDGRHWFGVPRLDDEPEPWPACPKHGDAAIYRVDYADVLSSEPPNGWYCEACEGEALDRSLFGRFTALGAAGEVFVGLCVNELAKAAAHLERYVRAAAGWLRGRWHR
jgi:hypothetical protein